MATILQISPPPTLLIHSIPCPQHFQPSNLICLQKQCQKKGLICPLCQAQDHLQHQVKPLKYFLTQLIPQTQPTQLTIILADIDLVIHQINKELNSIIVKSKQQSQGDQEQLRKTFDTYVSRLRTKIDNQLMIEVEMRQFFQSTKQLSREKVNEFITRYQLHQYEPQEKQSLSKQTTAPTNLQKLLHLLLQQLTQKHQDLLQLVKSRSETKDILTLFIHSETREKVSYHFSQELKHTAIKITDKLTAKQQHNYSSNFVLIEPMICGKKKTMDKKTVKLKIDKLNSWVNLGVCVKSKVVASTYYFNTQDIGHGAYTISNDGYSWHNTESASNSHYHGWAFAQGDTVTMVYDPKTKMIKYTKENGDKEFQLSCQPIPGQQMYFCVTLNTHDESVSIVQ